jgi:predicted dinucleotide-binding enzyme
MTSKPFVDHARRTFMCIAGSVLAVVALAAQPHVAEAQATGSPLKIGMVGAGREGGALGTLFVKAGHPVMFSSRHPENLKGLVAGLGPRAQAGTVEEAIAFGEVVVIAIPYAAMEQLGKAYAGALAKKVLVIDVSNPIARRDGEAFVKSVGEQGGAGLVTAKFLPGARIVRAFNAIGSGRLAELAHRAGEPVGVPIAGDDPKAIAVAQNLIREIGFEPVLVGGLAMGKYLVPGTPLGGEHTPAEIRQIAGSLHRPGAWEPLIRPLRMAGPLAASKGQCTWGPCPTRSARG